MTVSSRFRQGFKEEELITPKQREALAQRKAQLIAEIDQRLDQMPDSEVKQDLIRKRDHCIAKFPKSPVDLSIWVVAYHEDWLREYNRCAVPS